MNYYENIKELLINHEITKKVKINAINKSELNTYLTIGKILKDAGKKYGENIIKDYSFKLENDLGKKYSTTALKRYRQFYECIEKGATLSHQLNWSHYQELIPICNIDEINYYINKIVNNNLSVRQLRLIIKHNEYRRLPKETRNKIINNNNLSILDEVQDSILIKSNIDINKISEKYLHDTIIDNISDFMNQLGEGYSYVGHEYPIKLGNTNNYIDILLFNIKYNCYVVVELKVTELKKDHIGQIQIYMNYIDQNIKQFNHDKTIGLIVVRRNNEYIIRYSSDDRIKCVEWSI